MTAPERKMLAPNGGLPSGNYPKHLLVEYIRADIAAAMVAAEREAMQARIHALEAEIKQLRAASWAEGVRGKS